MDCPVFELSGSRVIRPVVGATDYLMCWFPVLSIVATVKTDTDIDGNVISWTLEGEEV